MNIILSTAYISLVLQIITGIVTIYGLFIKIPLDHFILKQILFLEVKVQIIELIFYTWLVLSFISIKKNITHVRYFDWFITTPVMLLTTIFFMEYYSNSAKNIFEVIKKSKNIILFPLIIFTNFLMLLFGYLGETKRLPRNTSCILGFVFFLITFYIIFKNYTYNNKVNNLILGTTFIIWSFYGFAYLLPYVKKNTFYNILDLISKNFYGLFIFLIIYTIN